MRKIQVDMFAVGLGAAVLTQFSLKDGDRLTVLADGGGLTSTNPNAVVKKLPDALKGFKQDSKLRLDLIVGTHYDADHLKGLIPIIEETSIEIGEIWLPPVRNDGPKIPGAIDADEFLAQLFFDDSDGKLLPDYLWDKAYQVAELYELERKTFEIIKNDNGRIPLFTYSEEGQIPMSTDELPRKGSEIDHTEMLRLFRSFFESHITHATARTGARSVHETASYDSNYLRELEDWKAIRTRRDVYDLWPDFFYFEYLFKRIVKEAPSRARVVPAALASVRRAKSEDAINGTYLIEVINALRKRSQHLRPQCHFVSGDRPSEFVWSSTERRFLIREDEAKGKVILKLLGPSDRLIQQLSDKIPVAAYAFALMRISDLTYRESITSASNRLSYIFTLEMDRQKILISGDAGCYGFRGKNNEFSEELLLPIASPQVVQVAHHGGRNYDFYHALIAAGFGNAKGPVFLLLSHEPRSKHRPSDAFREFIELVKAKRREVHLLFTSKPSEAKVHVYKDCIYSAVSEVSEEGDIRLLYGYRQRRSLRFLRKAEWQVQKHSIKA
jgi:hypothetical protein